MKISPCPRDRGLSLVEVLVILAILAILFMMLLPATSDKPRPGRIGCVINLKQIGEAELSWANDHGGKFSFELSETNGGTREFTTGADGWRHFQLLFNTLNTPKVLICSAESDRRRRVSTDFSILSNSNFNLSYFIGLDCNLTNPQGMLCGDRNITNGTSIKNGILELTTNQPAGWTEEMHKKVGNVLLSDGSVQQMSGSGLRNGIENTGVFYESFPNAHT